MFAKCFNFDPKFGLKIHAHSLTGYLVVVVVVVVVDVVVLVTFSFIVPVCKLYPEACTQHIPITPLSGTDPTRRPPSYVVSNPLESPR